jgi:hypothetical protein
MGAKVDFDHVNRLIIPNTAPVAGVITIDVQVDIYSDGKEDWLSDATLNKFRFPVQAIGGQDTAGGKLGTTYILTDGWHLRPYEADHTWALIGNMFTEDGSPLVQDTIGAYRVHVQQRVSTLVETIETVEATQIAADLDRLNEGVYGKKLIIDSDDPQGGSPGYMVLYEEDLTLIGYKEIYEQHTEAGDSSTVGYTRGGKGIGWEGPLVAGVLPP